LFGLPARELYNNIMSLIITKVHLSPTMSKAEVQGQLHLNWFCIFIINDSHCKDR